MCFKECGACSHPLYKMPGLPTVSRTLVQTELHCQRQKCEAALCSNAAGKICSRTKCFSLHWGTRCDQESQFVWHTYKCSLSPSRDLIFTRVGFPPWQARVPQFVSRENIGKVKFHFLMIERNSLSANMNRLVFPSSGVVHASQSRHWKRGQMQMQGP